MRAYIDERLEQVKSEKTANIRDIVEYLTSVMCGEAQSEELVLMPEFTDNTQTTLRLTPYWVIWFDRSWWHETFAAVNALTGEVDFVDNSR